MSKETLSRRQFLRLSAGSAAGALLVACGAPDAEEETTETTTQEEVVEETQPEQPETTAPEEEEEAEVSSMYNEAPMLAALVAAGELPPVDARLPSNPRVLRVNSEIGQYGGTWRRAYKGLSDRWGPTKLHEEMAMEWDAPDPDTINVVPGFVEKWEQNADASEFTFFLRQGLKWSDGVEMTTDDVQFWYDEIYVGDIAAREEYYTFDSTPMGLEVIDAYTWKLTFPGPNPLLPIQVAKRTGGMTGGPSMAGPAHYLSQFIPTHPNANQSMIDAAMEEYGVSTWQELFGDANTQGPIAFWFRNPDVPVINAWHITSPPPSDPLVMERNPYFYQVDEEGNQLPYIDQITHDLFESNDVFDLWIAEGRIDAQGRHTSPGNFTFYKENEAAGDYQVYLWRAASTHALHPNIAHSDRVLGELFDTADFRQALSISINREEINNLVYEGLLEPRQASPVSGSPNYDPEFETRWTEYDPDGAIALLDGLALEVGDDGFRLRPDGETLSFTILHRDQTGTPGADEIDLVVGYWRAIGLDVNQEIVERSLYSERMDSNEVDVGVWGADRNSVVMADAGRYLGITTDGPWGAAYARWLADSPTGTKIEPPEGHPIREIWDLWNQARTEPDETTRNALFKQLLDIHKEHPYMIGTVGEDPATYIIKNNFHNVPDHYIDDDTLRNMGHVNPQQFYFG
jgi:peptide/nickel transport system substrate-binding protein